ncbi:MAG: hypothetical protein L6R40_004965 [Gallowayella cf. fulva]|nr:MAG: hypothetical protein L6R40_004965 [Xanthomendoza cf. fulva]
MGTPHIQLDTLQQLCACFSMSPIFLDKTFDQFRNGWNRTPTYVWLSYAVNSGSSTYLLINCPDHIIIGDLDDFDDRMTSLLEFGKTCELMTPAGLGLSDSAIETLAYFKSRNRICRRWAENYIERTRLIMDLFFSIGSQVDSRTNLEIANLTSTIARDAQRDSSSLITIAAVTMVFLPGTFISAVFSMAFFNAGLDEHGKAKLEVSPLVWYFPAISIPLTILVFGVWEVWRRKRQAKSQPVDKLGAEKDTQAPQPTSIGTRRTRSGD